MRPDLLPIKIGRETQTRHAGLVLAGIGVGLLIGAAAHGMSTWFLAAAGLGSIVLSFFIEAQALREDAP